MTKIRFPGRFPSPSAGSLRRFPGVASIVLLAALLSACEDGRTRPPPVSVQVVNAAPTAPPMALYRIEAAATNSQLDFRGASSRLTFDEDEYVFSARAYEPGVSSGTHTETLTEFTQDVSTENEYVFVLTEVGGVVTPIVIEQPLLESGADARITMVHAAPGIAGMDAYFEAPDADLTTATPLGGIEFGDVLEFTTRPSGEYRLSFTGAGDPANVLFTSSTLEIESGDSYTFVLADDAGDGVAPFSVLRVGTSSGLMFDTGIRSGFQLINAAADQGARDLFVGGDYTAPVVSALAYGAASDLVLLSAGNRDVSVTPAGNPGVVDVEEEHAAVRGGRYTGLIAGEPGDIEMDIAADDNRRIPGHARLRFMNGASQYSPVEIFFVEPGTDLKNVRPNVELAAPQISQRVSWQPGEYELVLRDGDTVVYGPEPITLDSGVYTVLVVNGEDANTAGVVLLEDFQ